MSHRPYPNADRALHQLRRGKVRPWLKEYRPLSPLERALADYATTAVRGAAPGILKMVTALRERPVVGVRQTKETT